MSIRITIGQGSRPAFIAGRYANRHGLISGATGTGKSVTLMTLADGFSRIGIPSLLVDVKGDLARIQNGNPTRRLDALGSAPGERVTLRIDSLGPDLMARVLGLSDAQRGALEVGFALATKEQRSLATLGELRALLAHVAANHRQISTRYGLVSPSSIAAIQRALIGLEREGGADLFGRSTFDIASLEARAPDGRGVVALFDAQRLMRAPALYAATLLFLLTDIYDRAPEVGDLAAPRLVLFLDEAHLLFADLPAPMLQRIERTIRLIRSKGVAVFFASQSPLDIPPTIMGQLGNRIQHALRGATLADQRAIRATAETLPLNPAIDAKAALLNMGVGQALVSTIGENGSPQPVDLVRVSPPACMASGAAPNAVAASPRRSGGSGFAAPVAASAVAQAALSRNDRARATFLAFGFMMLCMTAFAGAVRLLFAI